MHTSPRLWGIIYLALVSLLVFALGAFDWKPTIITIEIPALFVYGSKAAGIAAALLFCHVYIGDRFDRIDRRFWDWVEYRYDDDPYREDDRTRYRQN